MPKFTIFLFTIAYIGRGVKGDRDIFPIFVFILFGLRPLMLFQLLRKREKVFCRMPSKYKICLLHKNYLLVRESRPCYRKVSSSHADPGLRVAFKCLNI